MLREKENRPMLGPDPSRLTRRSFLQMASAGGLALTRLPTTAGRLASQTIHLAVVLDTTGTASVYGIPTLHGLHLAASQVNARGGIRGHHLALMVSDGRSDLSRVTALVQRACHDPAMVALIGPTLSSEAVVVDPLAQAAHLPVLSVSNTVPHLTAIGSDVFRLALGDAQIIPAVLRTVHQRHPFQTAALLYDHVNAATAGAGQIFRKTAAHLGIRMVTTQTFASGTTQFGPHLDAIKAARPQVILVAALAQDAVSILRQRLRAGIPATTPIIGANGLNTPSIIRGAGPAAEGVIVGTAYDPDNPSPRNRHFTATFDRHYHHAPDVFAAQGYDGISTLVTALRRSHTLDDREALRAALAGLTAIPSVLSPTGHFSFTAQREPTLAPTVRIVRHGQFVRFS
jgi:branched-chain amino acid transport system substrate-binding protein